MRHHDKKAALREFQRLLLAWYRANQRNLPWRRTRSVYRIWVSETMLQQTRSGAALPYYRRFIRAFPTLKALSRARLGQVLRAWSGLGYYSRARNLHRAAKIITRRYAGRFPLEPEAVLALPGVGAYTARAVLSIGYSAPLAVLDGNVARVIARREAIRGDLRAPARWKQIQDIADRWLLSSSPGDWNQAMMELGATVCKPHKPLCGVCPARDGCRAFHLGIAERLPEPRTKRVSVRLRIATAILLDHEGRTLLVVPHQSQGTRETDPSGELAALFSRLPYFPALDTSGDSRSELESYLREGFATGDVCWIELPRLRHTVTFREITLEPWLVLVEVLPTAHARRLVVPLNRVAQMGVSSAVRKIVQAAQARLGGSELWKEANPWFTSLVR